MRRNLFKKNRSKVVGSLLVLAALFGVLAVGTTGAYFSDTHDGNITGELGSIRITPSGGSGIDSTNFNFTNMMPGEPQTATLNYENTGSNPQDVWVTFPNATALSSLNNLGTYGEVHILGNGTPLFDSANLNDRSSTCGPFSPSGCWPIPNKILVATNVAPGGTGTFQFTFNYASKLAIQPPVGVTGYFNEFPVVGQQVINVADGVGNGLPYRLVATQVGHQP